MGTLIVNQYLSKLPIVIEGLTLWLDAKNQTGTEWVPKLGNNTATLGGGCQFQSGYLDIPFIAGSWVTTNLVPNTDNNREFSYEMWFRDDAPGVSKQQTGLIADYGISNTTPHTSLFINNSGQLVINKRNTLSQSYSLTYSTPITDGNWHHLVYIGGSIDRLYVDNTPVLARTSIDGVTSSGQGIVIGGGHIGRYQSCQIAIVRIYFDKALSPEEIQLHYDFELPLMPL